MAVFRLNANFHMLESSNQAFCAVLSIIVFTLPSGQLKADDISLVNKRETKFSVVRSPAVSLPLSSRILTTKAFIINFTDSPMVPKVLEKNCGCIDYHFENAVIQPKGSDLLSITMDVGDSDDRDREIIVGVEGVDDRITIVIPVILPELLQLSTLAVVWKNDLTSKDVLLAPHPDVKDVEIVVPGYTADHFEVRILRDPNVFCPNAIVITPRDHTSCFAAIHILSRAPSGRLERRNVVLKTDL